MNHLIDLAAYPLHQPDSEAYAALVAVCRAALEANGMFDLPGFFRPEAALAAAEQAKTKMATESFRHARTHNVYFLDTVDGLSEEHPALARLDSINHTLCADQLARNPVLDLYEWPPFAAFLAATMGKAALFCMDDPLARVNIQSTRAGEALNWHFDRSEFTITMLLQASLEGGELEFRTNLRSADNANLEGIADVLRGEDPLTRRIALTVGALNVFRGVNTLHRVVPVKGTVERIIATLSFYERPGVAMTPHEQTGFFGRAAAAG